MNSRRLKVNYHPPLSQEPQVRLPPMPFLRLQGRWLDRAGFAVGSDVHVRVGAGRFVLEVMSPQRETD